MLAKYYDYLPSSVEIDINDDLTSGFGGVLKSNGKIYVIDILRYLPDNDSIKYLCVNYYSVKNYLKSGVDKFIFIPYVFEERGDTAFGENIILSTGSDYNNFIDSVSGFDPDIINARYFEVKDLIVIHNYEKVYMINGIERDVYGYLTEMVVSKLNRANKIIIYNVPIDTRYEIKELEELSSVFKFNFERVEDNLYVAEAGHTVASNYDLKAIMDLIINNSESFEYEKYVDSVKNCTLGEFMLYLMSNFSCKNNNT